MRSLLSFYVRVLLSFFIETLAISVLAYCIDTSLRYDFTNGLLFP